MRLFFVLALALVSAAPAFAQRAIVVIRHAEKANPNDPDPELSLNGEDRAISLTRFLRGAKVDAIFTSELRRTRDTAAPLARQRALKPETIKADDVKQLVTKLRALPKEAVAVVVGHSNTIPKILKELGVKDEVTVRDDEYGRVFLVTPTLDGGTGLLELSYDN